MTSSGTESSKEVPASPSRSSHRPRRLAVQTPRGTAISHASRVASVVKSRVLRARTNKSFLTGQL